MVTVKWLEITELSNNNKKGEIKYRFKIYDTRFECYSDQFDSLDGLSPLKEPEQFLDYLINKLPYFYKRIIEDQCFTLNGDLVKIDTPNNTLSH